MSTAKSHDFEDLLEFIDDEAEAEGPEAVAQLDRLNAEFALASQLITLRREAELTQKRLADLSGIPQSEISRIETGAANPTYATLTALGKPLGVPVVGWMRQDGVPVPSMVKSVGVARKAAKRSAGAARSSKKSSGGVRAAPKASGALLGKSSRSPSKSSRSSRSPRTPGSSRGRKG